MLLAACSAHLSNEVMQLEFGGPPGKTHGHQHRALGAHSSHPQARAACTEQEWPADLEVTAPAGLGPLHGQPAWCLSPLARGSSGSVCARA